MFCGWGGVCCGAGLWRCDDTFARKGPFKSDGMKKPNVRGVWVHRAMDWLTHIIVIEICTGELVGAYILIIKTTNYHANCFLWVLPMTTRLDVN